MSLHLPPAGWPASQARGLNRAETRVHCSERELRRPLGRGRDGARVLHLGQYLSAPRRCPRCRAASEDSPGDAGVLATLTPRLRELLGTRSKLSKSRLMTLSAEELRREAEALGVQFEGRMRKEEVAVAVLEVLGGRAHAGSPVAESGAAGDGGSADEEGGQGDVVETLEEAEERAIVMEEGSVGEDHEGATHVEAAREKEARATLREPRESGARALAETSGGEASGANKWRDNSTGLDLTWLGTSSGAPTQSRNVSCVVLRMRDGPLWIVDCGEGTARQFRNPRLGPGFEAERLSRVLVTHLHGDHCFGLPGMLTLADEARRGTAHEGRPIHVVGPPGVADLVHLGIGQLESFSTPVLVTEMVVRASDARPARTVGLHGLLTLERRAPDGGGVGGARPGSAGEAGRVVSRVPGPASWPNQGDLADAHGPRPLSPRGGPSRGPPRGAGNGRPRSDSPGSPRSRDWQTPGGPPSSVAAGARPNPDVWQDRRGRAPRRGTPPPPAAGQQGQQPADIIAGAARRVQRGPGPQGAGGAEGPRPGRRFAGRRGGYSLDVALSRVQERYRDELQAYRDAEPLTWTFRCEDGFTVRSTRLLHRVPCWGYVIQEPQGEGEGQGQGRKVVVLGDTHCSDHLVDIGRGCDVLVHEATFMDGQEGKAAQAGHSTARMAGRFADALGARTLVLTHFSPRFVARGGGGVGDIKAGRQGGDIDDRDVKNLQRQAEEETRAEVFAASDFFTLRVPSRGT